MEGEILKTIHVKEGSYGNSYEKIFGDYMNDDVKVILVDEPHLNLSYQVKYEWKDTKNSEKCVQSLLKYKSHGKSL